MHELVGLPPPSDEALHKDKAQRPRGLDRLRPYAGRVQPIERVASASDQGQATNDETSADIVEGKSLWVSPGWTGLISDRRPEFTPVRTRRCL